MKRNRRTFLRKAGIVTAGAFVLPNIGCQSGGQEQNETTEDANEEASTESTTPSLSKFGIQLYTL